MGNKAAAIVRWCFDYPGVGGISGEDINLILSSDTGSSLWVKE